MKIRKLCAKWQKLLRLQDWDIDFNIFNKKDYNEIEVAHGWEPGATNGHMDGDYFKHSAYCTLLKSSPDIEYTISHELAHVMHQEVREFVESLVANIENKELREYISVQWSDIHERSIHNTSRAFINISHESSKH